MSVVDVFVLSAIFIVANGVFVAAEFALLGSPRASLERQTAGGDRFAKRMLQVLRSSAQQDRYVATAQLGITIASLGLGMYCEHALAEFAAPYLGGIPYMSRAVLAGTVALGVLTLGHIVFGEMVPKGVALQRPERVARFTYWPMRVTFLLLYPFVALFNAIALLCLRAVGITRQVNLSEQVYTPEELQLIIEESEKGGALRAESGRILRELFEFGELTASQVMVPRVAVVGIPVGATPAVVRQILARQRHTRYPVFESDLDHIVGMVHAKDLLRRLLAGEPVTAADARRLPVVPGTASLDDVLATMQRSRAHMAIVIDEHGGTAGIVSLEDLFEEVVGAIDEGAPTSPQLVPEPDGSVRASGTVRLDELGQYFNIDLEHEDVDSLSGLVLARLGRPPVVGDVIDYGRIRLEVTATSGRGVREVRASLHSDPA